jgi:hypothetical protein
LAPASFVIARNFPQGTFQKELSQGRIKKELSQGRIRETGDKELSDKELSQGRTRNFPRDELEKPAGPGADTWI